MFLCRSKYSILFIPSGINIVIFFPLDFFHFFHFFHCNICSRRNNCYGGNSVSSQIIGLIHPLVKSKTMKLVFSNSPQSTQHCSLTKKNVWLLVRIMCGATCLPANFCFSELASKYPVQHVDLVQTRYYHHLIEKYFLLSMKLQKMAHLELSKNCSMIRKVWRCQRGNRRRTDNTMAKRKRTKRQTTIYKALHKKLKTKQHEPH